MNLQFCHRSIVFSHQNRQNRFYRKSAFNPTSSINFPSNRSVFPHLTFEKRIKTIPSRDPFIDSLLHPTARCKRRDRARSVQHDSLFLGSSHEPLAQRRRSVKSAWRRTCSRPLTGTAHRRHKVTVARISRSLAYTAASRYDNFTVYNNRCVIAL